MIRGESAYEIIERVCRWRGLLAYELPDGSLYLAQVGTTQAASGFTQGQNVQAASAEFSIDQRFSTYQCFSQSVATFAEEGWGGYAFYVAADNLVPRNRKRYIIAETGGWGEPICQQRAIWERNRRWGRSNALTLTTDSWRDSAGTLWTPNTLVPLSLPGLKVPQGVTWLIGDVTYHLNENGTTADLVIMPPEAFSPEPILLQPILPEFDPNWRP